MSQYHMLDPLYSPLSSEADASSIILIITARVGKLGKLRCRPDLEVARACRSTTCSTRTSGQAGAEDQIWNWRDFEVARFRSVQRAARMSSLVYTTVYSCTQLPNTESYCY